MSGRIAELEDQLSVRLLERSTRNLRLTGAGEKVLEHAPRSADPSKAIDNIFGENMLSASLARANALELDEHNSCQWPLFLA